MAERQTPDELLQVLRTMRITPAPLHSGALDRLLEALRESHANGGALFGRFRVAGSPAFERLIAQDRLDISVLFQAVVTSDAVRSAVPELGLGPDARISASFEAVPASTFDQELAGALIGGGAYRQFRGTPDEAREVAGLASAELAGGPGEAVSISRTYTPWAPWFRDVAWDVTWLGFDRRQLIVWLLCLTDTD